jgi:RNA polymerase-binding protein DksA
MSPAKKPTKPRSGSKTSAKKATSKKTSKATARKSTARSAASRKTAKKPVAKKTAAKKTSAKKTAKKTVAKKTPVKKKTAAKKTTGKKTTKKATSGAKKTVTKAPAKKSTAAKAEEAPPAKPVKQPLIRRAAPKPPPAKRVRPAKLTPDDLKRIKAQLEEERTDLERQLDELQGASFQGSQSDLTGEVGLDEDFADAGTATFDRERDLSIRNNIRDLIDQINRAMSRIDEGGYGTCERCGNPIDASRLKALPHASLCLDCKRREERVR